jgi:hypothetical protein
MSWTLGKPPNQRGKGGRPTKAEQAAAGELEGAEKAIQEVRAQQPQTFAVPPRRKSWEKQFDEDERSVERQEAEAILTARKERLSALDEQTTTLRANRRIALGFSGAALQLLKTMQTAAKELDGRVSRSPEDLTIKDLQQIIQVTGTTVVKAQTAVEAMVKTERYVMRHPLDDGSENADELEGLDATGAKQILENLSKSIMHISGKYAKDTAIVAEATVEPSDDAS